MFDRFDFAIRRTLKQLAAQRVRMILQPGNYWVLDNTGTRTEDTDAALLTCYMRGWVEPLDRAVPTAALGSDGRLPPNFQFDRVETHYRLTSAGWSAIHRSGTIAIAALCISVLSFALVIVKLVLGAA